MSLELQKRLVEPARNRRVVVFGESLCRLTGMPVKAVELLVGLVLGIPWG